MARTFRSEEHDAVVSEPDEGPHLNPGPGRLTEAERREAARRYEDGWSAARLARWYGVRPDRIREAARAYGVEIRPAAPVPKLSLAQRREVVDRYQAGEPMDALAEKFDISHSTIRRAVQAVEAELRPAGRGKRVLSAGEKAAIARRYADGETSRSLATEYEVTVPTVLNAVRAAGGQVRQVGRPRAQRSASG